jgi:hypothetical protein
MPVCPNPGAIVPPIFVSGIGQQSLGVEKRVMIKLLDLSSYGLLNWVMARGLIMNFLRVGISFTLQSFDAVKTVQQTLKARKNTKIKQFKC